MSYFDQLEDFPPDPIFGLAIEFASDGREGKQTFVTGYFQREDLSIPLFEAIHQAEKKLAEMGHAKSYLPPGGIPAYLEAIQMLVFGKEGKERSIGVQTLGGTGALYLAGRIANSWTDVIGISDPSWANHWGIFPKAGLNAIPYPYYSGGKFRFEAMKEGLEKLPKGAAVLLHTSCHNSSGLDPTQAEWEEVIALCKNKGLFPILDMAYQGFGGTPLEEATTAKLFLASGLEFALCYTCSKSFGLYGERVGAVFFVANDGKNNSLISNNLRREIRPTYSNPPTYGPSLVKMVLSDPVLKGEWEKELKGMRGRITEMRDDFSKILSEKDPETDWGVIKRGKGLFYAPELPESAVDEMRKEHAFYLGPEGRINLTGINGKNIEQLADLLVRMRKKHC